MDIVACTASGLSVPSLQVTRSSEDTDSCNPGKQTDLEVIQQDLILVCNLSYYCVPSVVMTLFRDLCEWIFCLGCVTCWKYFICPLLQSSQL